MESVGAVASSRHGWLATLNDQYHRTALRWFLAITIAHALEHVAQAFQIWVMGWDRKIAGGVLGMLLPTLVQQEGLHYAYAIVMLAGLIVLRPAFAGQARAWWTVALVIQFWHHIEHLLLLLQAIAHRNLFGKLEPTSIAQLVVPRVELHLLYNTAVFVPMVIGIWLHVRRDPAAI